MSTCGGTSATLLLLLDVASAVTSRQYGLQGTVMMSNGGVGLSFLASNQSITHVHIPKTAGATYKILMLGIMPPNHILRSNEFAARSLAESSPTSFLVTQMRRPRSHLISMFMHCKYFTYSPSIIRQDRALGFPTFGENGTGADIRGLELWLDHALAVRDQEEKQSIAVNGTTEPLQGTHIAQQAGMDQILHFDPLSYACYSPWNPQSRLLLMGPLYANHHIEPPVADVLAALATYDHVGTLELFNASACLLFVQLNAGSTPLGCGSSFDDADPRMTIPPTVEHGIPHLDESAVPPAVLAKIDKLTTTDQATYAWVADALSDRLRLAKIAEDAAPR